jgi:hypothetical protein
MTGDQFAPITKPYMLLYQERMTAEQAKKPVAVKPVHKAKKAKKKARK